jgi:RNA polymerase sigma-70 factor (ECF subfamily)
VNRAAEGFCNTGDLTGLDLHLRDRDRLEGVGLSDIGAKGGATAEFGDANPAETASGGADPLDDFQPIFERYARPVTGFLRDLLGDWALAEEMTQETFIRAFRSRGSKRMDTRISTWLFGIAFNVGREAIRDKYRRRNARDLQDPACRNLQDDGCAPDQDFIDKETRRIIQAALSQLSDAQRVVFILKVVNEMRYQEISAITGAGVGKLKTDLHRARIEMRRMLDPYMRRRVSGMRGNS